MNTNEPHGADPALVDRLLQQTGLEYVQRAEQGELWEQIWQQLSYQPVHLSTPMIEYQL